jgi:hypothetical protein
VKKPQSDKRNLQQLQDARILWKTFTIQKFGDKSLIFGMRNAVPKQTLSIFNENSLAEKEGAETNLVNGRNENREVGA